MTDTLQYKCYTCDHIGPKSDFPESELEAAECKRTPLCSEDIFPHRIYECTSCGRVFTQNDQWPDYSLDQDPVEEDYPFVCRTDDDYPELDKGCGKTSFRPHTPAPVPVKAPKAKAKKRKPN